MSGINHGANHSINIIYSGTMSAAMEAAIEGIPSVGFSFLNYAYDADFSVPRQVAWEVTQKMLETELPAHSLFNVNIPDVPAELYKGVKLARQANAKWKEEFDERRDPHGKKYYWLTGEFSNQDFGNDTDVWALENGYTSLVPVQFDLTDYRLKEKLQKEWQFQ